MVSLCSIHLSRESYTTAVPSASLTSMKAPPPSPLEGVVHDGRAVGEPDEHEGAPAVAAGGRAHHVEAQRGGHGRGHSGTHCPSSAATAPCDDVTTSLRKPARRPGKGLLRLRAYKASKYVFRLSNEILLEIADCCPALDLTARELRMPTAKTAEAIALREITAYHFGEEAEAQEKPTTYVALLVSYLTRLLDDVRAWLAMSYARRRQSRRS